MIRRRSFYLILVVIFVQALLWQATPTSARDPSPVPTPTQTSNGPDSAAKAFPNGLPEAAELRPDGSVLFADGAILSFNLGGPKQSQPRSSSQPTAQLLNHPPCCSNEGVPCPDYWICLYEHWHFNADRAGRRLQFADCCFWQNLANYSFDNMMSSYRHWLPSKGDARWAFNSGGGGQQACMDYLEENRWVGTDQNDRASSIYIYYATNICSS
jgi:hypothetical protein